MSKPKIIITGLTHSGSTYLINVFDALGIDITINHGMVDWNERHGREYGPLVANARKIAGYLCPNYNPPLDMKVDPQKIFDNEIRSTIKESIDEFDYPEVVKFPNEGWNWLIDLFDPELVIVTFRSPIGWLDSMNRWEIHAISAGRVKAMSTFNKFDAYASNLGHTISSLEYHDIDYTIIDYPKSAENYKYLYNKIKPTFKILNIAPSKKDVEYALSVVAKKSWIT